MAGGGRQGAGAYRRHGHPAARRSLQRRGLRRLVFAQRQRRDDRHHLGRGIRLLEGPVMITNTHSVGVVRDAVIDWRVAHGAADCHRRLVVAAGRGRDLGRLAERHQRLPRASRSTFRRARGARSGPASPKATSAAAPEWSATGSRAASAPLPAGSTSEDGGYTRRRAGAVQLRDAAATAHRRRPGGPGDHSEDARPRSRGRAGAGSIIVVVAHRRATLAASVEASRATRVARHRARTAASPATARATSSSPSRPPIPPRATSITWSS